MEELDFQGLLDKFGQDGFQKGEQVILANFGTNQTLLTLIFQKPANVKNIECRDVQGVIMRGVDLIAGEQTVGHALSQIPKKRNRQDIWEAVLAGELGLGQIIVSKNLPTRRNLVDVGHDDQAFWRIYTIEGPDVFFEISEHFPRQPFEEVGWIHKKGSKMTVIDDEGKSNDFSKFLAIGVQEDGGIFRAIEDENLNSQEALGVMLEGVEVLGEIASGLMVSREPEISKGGKEDGE